MTDVRRAALRLGLAGAVALLAGCLTSDALLFDAKNARATVFASGDWEGCQFDSPTAEPECQTIQIARDRSGLYTFSMAGEDETTHARFKSIGFSAWAAQMWGSGDDSPFYFLATRDKGAVTMTMIDCETLPAAFKEKYVARGSLEIRDESTCVAKTAAAVVAAAKAWRTTDAAKTGERVVYTRKPGA